VKSGSCFLRGLVGCPGAQTRARILRQAPDRFLAWPMGQSRGYRAVPSALRAGRFAACTQHERRECVPQWDERPARAVPMYLPHFVMPFPMLFVMPFRNFSRAVTEILAQFKTSLFVPAEYPLCTIVAHSTLRDSLSRHDVVVIATPQLQAARGWQWGEGET
jgi:hypothetical protein